VGVIFYSLARTTVVVMNSEGLVQMQSSQPDVGHPVLQEILVRDTRRNLPRTYVSVDKDVWDLV
jgi:hypothetical protein